MASRINLQTLYYDKLSEVEYSFFALNFTSDIFIHISNIIAIEKLFHIVIWVFHIFYTSKAKKVINTIQTYHYYMYFPIDVHAWFRFVPLAIQFIKIILIALSKNLLRSFLARRDSLITLGQHNCYIICSNPCGTSMWHFYNLPIIIHEERQIWHIGSMLSNWALMIKP